MKNTTKSNPDIASAFNAYQTFHQDPDLRSVAENCERYHLDAEAYADSCEARGLARGKAVGLIEGEAEGEARGKAVGLAEGKINVALSLLKEGVGIDFIARVTGLSEEEVYKLSQN